MSTVMVFSTQDSWDQTDFIDLEEVPASELFNPETLCLFYEEGEALEDMDLEAALQQLTL
tara:strand:- start:327 stop:506 length:180 start_codon:yes stop_codon:yes gene_type:complete